MITLNDCYLLNIQRPHNKQLTTTIESEGRQVLSLLRSQEQNPTSNDLIQVKNFLINVERWKADCMNDATGMAQRNNERKIWDSLIGTIKNTKDMEKLLSIMNLIGFGSSIDDSTGQRRAKRATAVLRFLFPQEWGVVDWRVCQCVNYFDKYDGNIGQAIKVGEKTNYKEIASLYDVIDENVAIYSQIKYRSLINNQLTRAADVELSFYLLSFLIWPPIPQKAHMFQNIDAEKARLLRLA